MSTILNVMKKTDAQERAIEENLARDRLRTQYPDAIIVEGYHTIDRVGYSTHVATTVVEKGHVFEEVPLRSFHYASGSGRPYDGQNLNQERWLWALSKDAVIKTRYRG